MASRSNQSPWISFFTVILLVALVATWLFIPRQIVQQAAEAEREQMVRWVGKAANEWINSRSVELLQELSREAAKVTSLEMNDAIKEWMIDRLYTTLLWCDVFVFRLYSVVIWLLIILPLLLAASADGFYAREIRKSMFTSQSPLRLRIGSLFFIFSMVLLFAWLFLPVALPVITAPFLMIMMAFSCWMWVANLQKRI